MTEDSISKYKADCGADKPLPRYIDPPIPESLTRIIDDNPGIVLEDGEVCIFWADCTALFPAKPLSFDFRTTAMPRISVALTDAEMTRNSGRIYITNRRYVSTAARFNLRWDEIEAIEGFEDGFVFYHENSVSIIIMSEHDANLMHSVINEICNK